MNYSVLLKSLGLSCEQALHGSVEVAYQAAYDVSEAEIDGWEEIRFIDTPNWLLEKVKKPYFQLR